MPWWIIADTSGHKRWIMGPYETSGRAQSIKDGLDDDYAQMFQTESYKRSEAAQEIRHKLIEDGNPDAGFKNFRHTGVES